MKTKPIVDFKIHQQVGVEELGGNFGFLNANLTCNNAPTPLDKACNKNWKHWDSNSLKLDEATTMTCCNGDCRKKLISLYLRI